MHKRVLSLNSRRIVSWILASVSKSTAYVTRRNIRPRTLLNQHLTYSSSLIQNDNGCITNKCSSQTDQTSLTNGQVVALVFNRGIQSESRSRCMSTAAGHGVLVNRIDIHTLSSLVFSSSRIDQMSSPHGVPQLLVALLPEWIQVASDSSTEEQRFLRQDRQAGSQVVETDFRDVDLKREVRG
jgi:hypothetical protein